MPRYTMRLTWPDTENDHVFRVDGPDASRCYRHALQRLEWYWHWTVYGSSAHGDEATLEQAQARFKEAFERLADLRSASTASERQSLASPRSTPVAPRPNDTRWQ